MKLKVIVETIREIDTDERIFRDLYEYHIGHATAPDKDYEKAIEKIEELTTLQCYTDDVPIGKKVIVGVLAEDDTPILEF